MAISLYTVTGNAADVLGGNFDPKRVKVVVSTNLPRGTAPVDLEHNRVLLGASVVWPQSDGSFTIPNLVGHASADVNPTGIQYKIDLVYVDAASRQEGVVSSGWVSITADAEYSELIETQYAPPNYQSAFLEQAEALRDQQVELSGIDSSDTATAYNIEHGTATPSVLSASIGQVARRPQTVVVFGDSLTEQGGEIPPGDAYGVANGLTARNNPDCRVFAAWTWANVLLNQAFSVLANYGIGGQTTSQILARVDDVIALNPGWVIITAGTNNAGVAGGVAQAQSDLAAMLDAFEAAGIRAVLLTLPPRAGSYTGTQKGDTLAINEWIRQQARLRPGLLVADVFPALADGTASNYLATTLGFNPSSDGIHLSATGGYACGKVLADVLRPHINTLTPYSNPNPGANLLTNGRPAGTTTAAPTGWNVSGGSGLVWSDVARADGAGSWKQLVVGSGTVNVGVNATVDGTRLAVGDTVNAIGEFSASSMDQAAANDAQGIALSIRAWNGSTYTDFRYAFNYFRGPNNDHGGVMRVPDFVVPGGTTLLTYQWELRGAMTFRFDKVGLYARRTYPV